MQLVIRSGELGAWRGIVAMFLSRAKREPDKVPELIKLAECQALGLGIGKEKAPAMQQHDKCQI